MTDVLLRVVPRDPAFVPIPQRGDAARQALEMLLPADTTSVSVARHVFFVDCGANLQSIHCPLCDAEISTTQFRQLLDAAAERQFKQLRALMPCCTGRASLSELQFTAPCAFARFMLESRNPARADLTPPEVAMLERVVGCRLRVVVARA